MVPFPRPSSRSGSAWRKLLQRPGPFLPPKASVNGRLRRIGARSEGEFSDPPAQGFQKERFGAAVGHAGIGDEVDVDSWWIVIGRKAPQQPIAQVSLDNVDWQGPNSQAGHDHAPHFLKVRRSADDSSREASPFSQQSNRAQRVRWLIRLERNEGFSAQGREAEPASPEETVAGAAEEAEVLPEKMFILQARMWFAHQTKSKAGALL